MPQNDNDGNISSKTVRVWDAWVRSIHWLLVIAILVAYCTPDGLLAWHKASGYLMLVLVMLRVAWGFVGTRHARFADFVLRPGNLARYVRLLLTGREPRYVGHNPAGAAMILLLLTLLLAIGVTGWLITLPAWRDDRPLQEAHGLLSDVVMLAAAFHVAGVMYASVRHRENLIWAMITGRKRA